MKTAKEYNPRHPWSKLESVKGGIEKNTLDDYDFAGRYTQEDEW